MKNIRQSVLNEMKIQAGRDVEDQETFNDIGMDSLSIVESVMAVESELGINIPDEYIPLGHDTVGEFIKAVEAVA